MQSYSQKGFKLTASQAKDNSNIKCDINNIHSNTLSQKPQQSKFINILNQDKDPNIHVKLNAEDEDQEEEEYEEENNINNINAFAGGLGSHRVKCEFNNNNINYDDIEFKLIGGKRQSFNNIKVECVENYSNLDKIEIDSGNRQLRNLKEPLKMKNDKIESYDFDEESIKANKELFNNLTCVKISYENELEHNMEFLLKLQDTRVNIKQFFKEHVSKN